jgi:hypothetical protein
MSAIGLALSGVLHINDTLVSSVLMTTCHRDHACCHTSPCWLVRTCTVQPMNKPACRNESLSLVNFFAPKISCWLATGIWKNSAACCLRLLTRSPSCVLMLVDALDTMSCNTMRTTVASRICSRDAVRQTLSVSSRTSVCARGTAPKFAVPINNSNNNNQC